MEHFSIFLQDNESTRPVYFLKTIVSGRGEFLIDLKDQADPHLVSSSQKATNGAP